MKTLRHSTPVLLTVLGLFYLFYPFQNVHLFFPVLKPYYLFFLLLLALSLYEKKIDFEILRHSILVFYLPFLCLVGISIFYSVDPAYSLYMTAKYLIYFIIAVTLSSLFLADEKFRRITLWAIVFSALIVSVIYLYKYYRFAIPILQKGASMQTIGELATINVGFGGGRNLMASWLAFAVTFPLFYLLSTGRKGWQKTLLTVTLVTSLTAIVFSLSRTSLLSVLLFGALVYLFSGSRPLKKEAFRLLALLIGIVVFVLIANPAGFGDYLATRFLLALGGTVPEHLSETLPLKKIAESGADYGVAGRKELWLYAWESIKEHPWLGNGIGNLYHGLPEIGKVHNYHNLFIQFFAQLGFIGFLLFGLWSFMLIKISWHLFRTLQTAPADSLLATLLFVNLIVYYFKGMLMFQYVDLEIWTLIAFVVYLQQKAPARRDEGGVA